MDQTIWESAFADDRQEEDPVDQEIKEEVSDSLSRDLSTLVNFGRLTTSFDFWGHSFVIKTLKMGEELEVGNIASAYSSSIDDGARAFIAAIVAACIQTVDGDPIIEPLGPNDKTVIGRRFHYMLDNYYWSVIEHVYEKYVELNERVTVAIEEFKKK